MIHDNVEFCGFRCNTFVGLGNEYMCALLLFEIHLFLGGLSQSGRDLSCMMVLVYPTFFQQTAVVVILLQKSA